MKEEITFTGALPDPRTSEERAKDYPHSEFIGFGIPVWEERKRWVTLDQRFQITSSSCGGQAGAKAVTSFTRNIMSANPIYQSRSNYPSAGMYQQQIGEILLNKKTCLEIDSPSQNMTEADMNAATIPFERPYGISGYYFIPTKGELNMDLLAQALDKGHALILGLESNAQEWQVVPEFRGTTATFSHFVTCVPANYILYNNEKALVIDDSCNPSTAVNGQRVLTEEFIKARVWGIMALIPAVTIIQRPKHTFNVDLSYGMSSKDVVSLQDILKYEGLFPTSTDSTGKFGDITKKAVIKLQEKHAKECLTPAGLTQGTGYVGKYTRAYLNATYGV